MKKRKLRLAALFLTGMMAVSAMAGCTAQAGENRAGEVTEAKARDEAKAGSVEEKEDSAELSMPKYIFLFIGDGMSYPQIQSAAYYLGTTASDGGVETTKLSFMDFPVTGSAQTYDSTSFCPDSASTATSISTGNKTYSGTINVATDMTTKFEAISEKLKKQKDYKIGVLSTVNLNHATPAAFYAHQDSRKNYYAIGEELIASDFDYFAGGALLAPTGENEDQPDLYEKAEEAGYQVVKTQAEAEALKAGDGKSLAVSEYLADEDAMPYSLDAGDEQWGLSDYVKKGIEVLDNDNGFFMMVEGGKIDWACHANDAGSSIGDTLALDQAVQEALAFYNEHPDETLILVTGDHETGGLTIGYAGTDYDTYMTNLENQKISYAKYNADYVAGYKENKTPFSDVLKDIKENFGLMTADDADAAEDSKLVLTEYEYGLLEQAYNRTMETGSSDKENMSQEEYEMYGTYEPLSVTITHILNNKSGINFASYAHTGLPVPVFAIGCNETVFEGYYDNTDIYKKLAEMTQVQ